MTFVSSKRECKVTSLIMLHAVKSMLNGVRAPRILNLQ